ALLPATVNLSTALTDGNLLDWTVRPSGALVHGFMFDESRSRLSVVSAGTSIAFVNDTGNSAASEEGHDEVVLQQADLAGLLVQRKVFVPGDGYFVRRLDILTNPGLTDVTVDVVHEVALGQAANVVASAADGSWAVFDDTDTRDVYESGSVNTSAFAPLASVVFGPGGTPPVATRTEDGAYALLSYRWNALTIPAGGSWARMQVLPG